MDHYRRSPSYFRRHVKPLVLAAFTVELYIKPVPNNGYIKLMIMMMGKYGLESKFDYCFTIEA
jgi:hypothetical protein